MCEPYACVSRSSGARSPRAAPTSPDTSASIGCCTTQQSDSRRKPRALTLEQVADDLLARHPPRLGYRGDSPLVVSLVGTDEFERRAGRTISAGFVRRAPTPRYGT